MKSTIHWVSAAHAVDAEVRVYDTLFLREDPNETPEGEDFTANLNPESLVVLTDCKLEPALGKAARWSASSSSGSATSASTPTPRPANRSSIEP